MDEVLGNITSKARKGTYKTKDRKMQKQKTTTEKDTRLREERCNDNTTKGIDKDHKTETKAMKDTRQRQEDAKTTQRKPRQREDFKAETKARKDNYTRQRQTIQQKARKDR